MLQNKLKNIVKPLKCCKFGKSKPTEAQLSLTIAEKK